MKQQPIEQQLITLIQSHVSNTAIQKHMIDLVAQVIPKERQRIVDIVKECVEFQRRKDPDTVLINKIDLLEAINEL